jgi:hypothetical protein
VDGQSVELVGNHSPRLLGNSCPHCVQRTDTREFLHGHTLQHPMFDRPGALSRRCLGSCG